MISSRAHHSARFFCSEPSPAPRVDPTKLIFGTAEETAYYYTLTQTGRRLYRIRMGAYLLSTKSERAGKTPRENWIEAVKEEDARLREGKAV
jgi:hypothetical protein